MKNLIVALMCTALTSIIFANEPANTSNTFEIKGFFLYRSNVTYTVYEITKCDTVEVITDKKFREYSVKLEVGKRYLICFAKKDFVKYLYVTANHTGEMELDVDFRNKHSGCLTYDKVRNQYTLKPKILPYEQNQLKNN